MKTNSKALPGKVKQANTPTPWQHGIDGTDGDFYIEGPNGETVGHFIGREKELEFVIRACNSHEKLLRIAKSCAALLRNTDNAMEKLLRKAALEVITEAGGE